MTQLAVASAGIGVLAAFATSPYSPFRNKDNANGNLVGTLQLPQGEQQKIGDIFVGCVKEQYHLNDQDLADVVRELSEFGAIPIYKPLMGVPVLGGASKFTNFINAFGFFFLKNSTERMSFKLMGTFRPYTVVGRLNVVAGSGFSAYDMTSIGLCVNAHL